jgi:uncharacterized damage-inducible protein DinB
MIAHIMEPLEAKVKVSRMKELLMSLFRHKAWADDALLDALIKLGDRPAVVALALKALSHTYVIDRIFAAHLRRASHGFQSANLAEAPALEELSRDIRASDQEYLDYVTKLEPTQLAERIDFTFTDGAKGRMSREEMLLHVITHGVGHRGQVSALMLLNDLPAVPDGFTTYLHRAEAAERRRAA